MYMYTSSYIYIEIIYIYPCENIYVNAYWLTWYSV